MFKAGRKYTINETFLSSGIKYAKSIWCIVLISILFFYFLSKDYSFAFLHYTMHTTALLICSDFDANFKKMEFLSTDIGDKYYSQMPDISFIPQTFGELFRTIIQFSLLFIYYHHFLMIRNSL